MRGRRATLDPLVSPPESVAIFTEIVGAQGTTWSSLESCQEVAQPGLLL